MVFCFLKHTPKITLNGQLLSTKVFILAISLLLLRQTFGEGERDRKKKIKEKTTRKKVSNKISNLQCRTTEENCHI